MRFPWPQPEAVHGPVIRLVTQDAMWRATAWRAIKKWRTAVRVHIPVVVYPRREDLSDRPTAVVDIVEVSQADLASVADWLSIASRTPQRRIATMLCRKTLQDPEHKGPAEMLLREAGARLTIATPQEIRSLIPLLDRFFRLPLANESNPLDGLPVPCWGPAWQKGESRDRVG